LSEPNESKPKSNRAIKAASEDQSELKGKSEGRRRGVRMCPKCGSTNVFYARGLAQLWSIWECRHCGYYGAFIIEDGKLSKKLQEEYAKKHPYRSRVET
jgi:ribosomal protein L37AE/L43A